MKFKKDPVVLAVNDLILKSRKGKKKVEKTVSAYLGYSVTEISELIKAFEKIAKDENLVESMRVRAERKYGELGKRMVELSLRNTMAMLKLREIVEKENLGKVEGRKQAVDIITRVFGSPFDYIDLIDEMVTIEEILSENKNPLTRFFSGYTIRKYRRRLEELEKELIGR
ncbi:MAG TPA: hypothetical protein EYP30_07075 [Archaeoglobaceae archaeon]|nr:hypothetical protein [Archaeoglobaceae archaeon]